MVTFRHRQMEHVYIHTYKSRYTHTYIHTRIHTFTHSVTCINTLYNPSAILECHLISARTFKAILTLLVVSVSVSTRKGSPGYLLIHCADRGGLGSDFFGYRMSTYCTIKVFFILQPFHTLKSFAIRYIALPMINRKVT